MKISGMILAVVLLATGMACAQDDSYTPVERQEAQSVGAAMRYGLGRGFANLLTCWLEVPRNLSFEATARPLSAPLLGPLSGASYTAMRAVYGVVDLLSAGYTGRYSYSSLMPDYAWQSPWLSDTTQFD